MGNTCTTILTKDSIEQNLNIKKETYNYKLYKKSRTNKNVKKKRNKIIDSNSIIYDNLQNNQQIINKTNLDYTNKIYNKQIDNEEIDNKQIDNEEIDNKQIDNKQIDNEEIDSKKCTGNIKNNAINIEEKLNDNKKIKELNNYINLLEEELMNNTIISIKEKIKELDKKKAINNKITKLKNKNAKLFKSYIDLKKTSDSY